MSEDNSLLAQADNGPSEGASPVDSAPQEPSFGEIVDANNKTAQDFLDSYLEAKASESNPAEQPVDTPVEEEVVDVSEDSSEETPEETNPDESTDDSDSAVEESDDDEFVEDSSDVDLFDADSLREGAFEVQWGEETKVMTWDQIQKQLNRSRSASEKSREAKELTDQLEHQQQELTDRESRLEKFDLSNQHDREMVALDLQYRAVSEQIDNAEGSVPKALLQRQQDIVDRFHEVKAAKDSIVESLRVDIPSSVSGYVTSNLSKDAQTMVASDPTLLKAIEKAQKWDNSQKKVAAAKPRLKAQKAGPKGRGSSVPKGVDSKKAAEKAKITKGQFSKVDPNVFLSSYLAAKS